MARVIGIDLGTTNTAVAVIDGGRPRVLEDERGYKVLPSVVSARGEGRFIVGQAAHNLIITHPDKTVYATKRLIGRRFDSPEVQQVMTRVQYKLRPAADGGVQMLVGDQWMTPTEVAAVILQVAKGIAERSLRDEVTEAVVTVPAYFNHAQRKATLEAAQLAGLKCDRLLNEPTAAALAYGHRKNIDRTIAIFDLGGGTFDVSVLRLSQGIYEILSSTGDTFLGGEDFDYRVVDHLADRFQARTRIDIRQDRTALQRVKDAAERAKCELSFSDTANVVIPHLVPGEGIETILTRTELERVTGDLVDRCLEIARRAVSDAGLSLSDVEEVILVGGQTRMPKVREAVAGLFGREPNRSVHPEEVVAIGAAVQAENLGEGERSRVVLLDVTPFDLGIDTAGGLFVPIVSRNARVPASETKVFATVSDQQETVRVTVRQGDSRASVQNEFLGEFVLEGLTPAPRLQTKVDVTFRIDSNGMLDVSAVERGTGERKQITIRNYAEHARSPQFPDAEQARADELMRKLRAAQGSSVAAAAAPAKVKGAGKVGLIDRLLGRKPKPPKAAAAPPPAAPPPEVATPVAPEELAAGPAAVGAAEVAGAAVGAATAFGAAMAAGAASSATAGVPPTGGASGRAGWNPGGDSSVIETVSGVHSGIDAVGSDTADVLAELEEMDALPADGLVLDPLVEPLADPALVNPDLDAGMVSDLGLAPIEEDAYADEGVEASLGLAGGVAGQAGDLFGGPATDLGAPDDLLGAGDSLADLFGAEGLGDVEVVDPFASKTAPVDDGPPLDPFAGRGLASDTGFSTLGEGPLVSGSDPSTREAFDPFSSTPMALDEDDTPPVVAEAPRAAPPDPTHSEVDELPDFGDLGDLDELGELGDGVPLDGAAILDEVDFGVVATVARPMSERETPTVEEAPRSAPSAGDLPELDDLPSLDDLGALSPAPAAADPFTSLDAWDEPIPARDPLTDPDLLAGPRLFEPAPTVPEELAPVPLELTPLSDLDEPGTPDEAATQAAPVDTGFALLDPDTDVRRALANLREGRAPRREDRAESAITSGGGFRRTDPDVHTDPGVRTPPPSPAPARKPARVKLHYRDLNALVSEYRENLRRGGTFIRTEKPLPVGRECVFEVAAPGLPEPLVMPATVVFVATAAPGQDAGMAVEYQLGEPERARIEHVLSRV